MVVNPDSVLRYIVAVHFVFTSMVNMANWLPFGYTLNQIALIVIGIWAIVQSESVIHVELLILVQFFTVILDSIAIGMYFQIGKDEYENFKHKSYFDMSAFFAFALLFMKIPTLLLLNKVRRYRLGDPFVPPTVPWSTPNDTEKQAYQYIAVPEQ